MISAGGLLLDLRVNEVSRKDDGRAAKLTGQQAEILAVLMEADGEVVSDQRMLSRLHGPVDRAEDRPDGDKSLKVQIAHMRKRLEAIDSRHMVQSSWGQGYRFAAAREPTPPLWTRDQWAAFNRALASHMRVSPADVALLRRRA